MGERGLWRRRVFFFIVLFCCGFVIWPLALPFAVGLTFAYVCEAPINRILIRLKKENSPLWRWAVALFVVLSVLHVFLLPLGFFVYRAVADLAAFIGEYQDKLSLPDLLNRLLVWVREQLQNRGIEISSGQLLARLREAATALSRNLADGAGSVLSGTPSALFNTVLALMTWVYFAVNGKRFRDMLLPVIIPWERERALIRQTTGEVMRAIIVANVTVSLIQAGIVSLSMSLAGIPNFYLWGGVAFFASFVPLLGTAPIMVGGVIYCMTQDKIPAAIGLGIGAVIVGSIDNILRPFFVKGSAQLNFFWVFVAFIGGIAAFGVAGTVLGPLFFSLFLGAYRMLIETREGEENANGTDGGGEKEPAGLEREEETHA